MAGDSFVQVKGLMKRFGALIAVSDVSFTIERGERFGLLGPNGAGKTTILSMMTGTLAPDAGTVLIGGDDVWRSPLSAKRRFGLVPQEIALYPMLSAEENLAFFGSMVGLKGAHLRKKIDDVLEVAGLSGRRKERIERFSGGMKRRINIAAALLHEPELIIMDEPTVGIDPQSRAHILETVMRLNREFKMTVMYTSHYMEEVEYLCERVLIVDHGKVIADGPLDEVKKMAGEHVTIEIELKALAGEREIDEALHMSLSKEPSVLSYVRKGNTLQVIVASAEETLMPLLESVQPVAGIGWVRIKEPNLESVFLKLTGRSLRDI